MAQKDFDAEAAQALKRFREKNGLPTHGIFKPDPDEFGTVAPQINKVVQMDWEDASAGWPDRDGYYWTIFETQNGTQFPRALWYNAGQKMWFIRKSTTVDPKLIYNFGTNNELTHWAEVEFP